MKQAQPKPQSPAKAPAGKKAPTSKRRDPSTYGFKKGDPKTVEAAKKGAQMGGRPLGVTNMISEAKRRWLNITGMSPLDFLTAVYRDQLYDDYEVEVVDEKKGVVKVFPRLDPVTGQVLAKKIPVELDKRIAAATAAAPYVHRKRPIGIDGGDGKPISFISADRLANLSNEELAKLLEVMGKLGVGAEFEGHQPVVSRFED